MATRSNCRVSKSTKSVSPLRRSPRLQKISDYATQSSRRLVSPPPSRSQAQVTPKKRRHADFIESTENHEPDAKRRALQGSPVPSSPYRGDPIAYWAATGRWPDSYSQGPIKMSVQPNSKRKSSSTHYSDRQRHLEQHGIYLNTSTQLQQKSKEFCKSLLDGELRPGQFPCYPPERVDDVLNRVQRLNEARLQRDVMPWVVPSAENLVFSGKLEHEYVGEEVDAEWIRCEPMGSTKPKPDFVVGLQRSAFTLEEWAKLDNCATSLTTFNFTPNLWFPFLICEAKTDRVGLELADIQNIHSGSIAIRSILRVCIAAYGRHHQKVEDLFGKILVFTVSHNHQQVHVYGHYARAKDGGNDTDENFEYSRYEIAMFSLRMADGEYRYNSYNFIRNLYNKFIPEHRDRIREAIGKLEAPQQRTGLSFNTASIDLQDEGESQSNQMLLQESGVFKTPSEPASAATRRMKEFFEKEMARMTEQSDKVLQQLERQMEEQRRESREKEERMERQMEEQRRESRERLEEERRESREKMEEQRRESREKEERMERQMEQLTKMITALSEAKGPS